jgi:hypothetical protein
MRRKVTSWTNEEDDELWHLVSQGVSRMRLSVRLRRTERAIQSRLTLLRKKHGAAGGGKHQEQGVRANPSGPSAS